MQIVAGFVQMIINKVTGGKPGALAKLIMKFIELSFKLFTIKKIDVEIDTNADEGLPLQFEIEMKLLGIEINIQMPPENEGLPLGSLSNNGILGLFMMLSPSALISMFNLELPTLKDLANGLMDDERTSNPSMECSKVDEPRPLPPPYRLLSACLPPRH